MLLVPPMAALDSSAAASCLRDEGFGADIAEMLLELDLPALTEVCHLPPISRPPP